MTRCTFCDDDAVGFGFIQPPMCQRHYEVARMMAILESKPTGVSLPALCRMLWRVTQSTEPGAVLTTVDDVPLLVWDHLQRYERIL